MTDYSSPYLRPIAGVLERDMEIIIETASHGALCGTTLAADSVMLLELDYYRGSYQASLLMKFSSG